MKFKMEIFWVTVTLCAVYLGAFVQCNESVNKSKVIIIGAGASGIAAAAKLVTLGIEDFIVLEAEDRIGGRVNTLPYELNTSIDMGAQWVHGNNNPVYEMALEHHLVNEDCPNYYSHLEFFNSSGQPVQNDSVVAMYTLVDELLTNKTELVKQNGSLAEYVRERLEETYRNDSSLTYLLSVPLFDELLDFVGKYQNSVDGSDSWTETSARGFADIETLEGCETNTWKKGGYANVFKLLLKQLPGQTPIDISKKVFINKEVQKVDWTDPTSISVECADGSKYSAEKVLTTVSLGVLKSSPGLFVPSLPTWKRDAIEGLHFGTVNKIFLRFPHKWWTEEWIGINLLWTVQDEKTLLKDVGTVNGKPWVVDVYGFYSTTEDPQTLLGWVSGQSARYMESLSDTQVQTDTMKLLRHFLSANYTIPDPIRIVKSSWFSKKHFKGSYSCHSLVTDKLNTSARALAGPVLNTEGKPILLFAGEATNSRFYGTVHGAVETGWREADRIANVTRAEKMKLLK